jgi:trigger factor
MKVEVQKPAHSEQKISIELDQLEMEKYYQQALKRLSTQINIKGFRPGKIPTSVVEQHLSKELINNTAAEIAIPVSYTEAVQEHKIEAIGRPSVIIHSAIPLKYEAIIPIYPEVKVEGYQKIKLIGKKVEVSEEELNEEIERLRKSNSKYIESDRPAQFGDRIEIDFDGFDESGVQLENTSSKSHPLVLGDRSFVNGFEDQIVGMTQGEKKEVKVTFPSDYFHEPFKDKVVIFKVRLVRHEIMNVPELNEEFVKKITKRDKTVDEFKKEVKENLQKNKEYEETMRLQGEMLQKIVDVTVVEIPKTLLEEEIEHMIYTQKAEMKDRGVEWKQYLEATQQSEEEMRAAKKGEAESRLKLRFGLNEVFKQAKIEVSEQEIEKAFHDEMEIMASIQVTKDMINPSELKNRLTSRIKMDKLLASITQ